MVRRGRTGYIPDGPVKALKKWRPNDPPGYSKPYHLHVCGSCGGGPYRISNLAAHLRGHGFGGEVDVNLWIRVHAWALCYFTDGVCRLTLIEGKPVVHESPSQGRYRCPSCRERFERAVGGRCPYCGFGTVPARPSGAWVGERAPERTSMKGSGPFVADLTEARGGDGRGRSRHAGVLAGRRKARGAALPRRRGGPETSSMRGPAGGPGRAPSGAAVVGSPERQGDGGG